MVEKNWEKEEYQKLMSAPDKMVEALKGDENEQPDENLIHLTYSGSVVSKEDILKFEKQLEGVGFRLNYTNTDGVIQANHFEFNNEILFQLSIGFAGSAIYDIVKTFILSIWEQGKTKLINKLQSGAFTKHQPITAFVVYVGKHKSITYVLPNDIPLKTAKKAMDNLLEVTKTHQKKYEGKKAYYEHYRLQKNGLWKHTKLEPSKKKLKQSKELLKQIMKKTKA